MQKVAWYGFFGAWAALLWYIRQNTPNSLVETLCVVLFPVVFAIGVGVYANFKDIEKNWSLKDGLFSVFGIIWLILAIQLWEVADRPGSIVYETYYLVGVSFLGLIFYMWLNRERMSWKLMRSMFTTLTWYAVIITLIGLLVSQSVDIRRRSTLFVTVLGIRVCHWVTMQHRRGIELDNRKSFKQAHSNETQARLESLTRLLKTAQDGELSDTEKLSAVAKGLEGMIKREKAASKSDEELTAQDNITDRVSNVFEWLWQKRGELFSIDHSDLMMAYAVGEVRRLSLRAVPKVVPLSKLAAIHPIDRDEANEKTNKRAKAFADAYQYVKQENWEFHANLCYAMEEFKDFQSLTPFEAVEIDGEYITFEGNGRREALQRAMLLLEKEHPETKGCEVQVEILLHKFEDSNWVTYLINKTRKWKKVFPRNKNKDEDLQSSKAKKA